MGLGLELSIQIVKMLNGTFEIQSKEDRGTTVLITLPITLI
jgi:signal transduction histidine kinase